MKKLLILSTVLGILAIVSLAAVNLISPAHAITSPFVDINGVSFTEGALISANQSASDPDIYIVNNRGYKRLFLNPAIFSMYSHLGDYSRVHQVSATVRDSFVTSGLFRNCETNDQKVWATEVTGEDTGVLHHVQMTGDQAIAEDPGFFAKVFCINTNEDNFYAKSITPYYRLAEIPPYFRRACQIRPACLDTIPRCLMPEPIEGWCPTPTPTPPTGCYYQQVQCIQAPCLPVLVCPTPPFACGQVCVSDSDCGTDMVCYQPPFSCPSGQYCAQVMPAKVCRLASNPTNASCQ